MKPPRAASVLLLAALLCAAAPAAVEDGPSESPALALGTRSGDSADTLRVRRSSLVTDNDPSNNAASREARVGQTGEPPAALWTKYFGGLGDADGFWVEQTNEGGYIACGTTGNASRPLDTRSRSYLVKTDGSGNLMWEKSFGGAPTEVAHSVRQMADGGYIVVGERQARPYLRKTDSVGYVQWERVYEETPRGFGFTGQPTRDGGFAWIGYSARSDSSIHLAKTDSLGDVSWNAYYSGPKPFFSNVSMEQTRDGGYVLSAGAHLTSYGQTLWVTKTDSLGSVEWQRTYAAQLVGDGCSIVQTPDGGYAVTGFGGSADDLDDPCAAYLLKLDTVGNPTWKRTFGGDGQDAGLSVASTNDGGYVMAGKLSAGSRSDDAYLVKTDSLGDLIWQTSFGSPTCADDARCVRQTSDGGYVIVGGGFANSQTGQRASLYLRKLAAGPMR